MEKNSHEILKNYIKAFLGRFKHYPEFAVTEVANGIQTTILINKQPLAIGYYNTNDTIRPETYTLSAIEAFKNFVIDIEN